MLNIKKLSLLLLLLFFLTGGAAYSMSVEREVEVGREGGKKLEERFGVSKERQYDYRIKHVGKKIASHASRTEVQYHFKVLNTEKFNAMAFPGGFIYVTRGLMDRLNDGELAFVLGHEAGHVIHRHSITQAEKQILTTIGIFALTALFSKGRINEGSANTALILSHVVGNQYSQNDEREADREGIKLMTKAGYDPKHAASAMTKLKEVSGEGIGVLNTFLGSHPLPQERIIVLGEMAEEMDFEPTTPDPGLLTGNDYIDKSGSGADVKSRHLAVKTESIVSFDESIELFPHKASGMLEETDYAAVSSEELKKGEILKDWGETLQRDLAVYLPHLKPSVRLKEEAQKLSGEKVQPVVSNEKVLWSLLLDGEDTSNTFMEKAKKNIFPAIFNRRSDLNYFGVSALRTPMGKIHVVLVMN